MSPEARTDAPNVLLRRYFIKPGHWPAFLALWRQVVPLRRRHGFEVLFALKDEENNVFTWAVSYDGDLQAAMDRYYADPERVALEVIGEHVADFKVTSVEREPIP
jgi:hypothetical protein